MLCASACYFVRPLHINLNNRIINIRKKCFILELFKIWNWLYKIHTLQTHSLFLCTISASYFFHRFRTTSTFAGIFSLLFFLLSITFHVGCIIFCSRFLQIVDFHGALCLIHFMRFVHLLSFYILTWTFSIQLDFSIFFFLN